MYWFVYLLDSFMNTLLYLGLLFTYLPTCSPPPPSHCNAPLNIGYSIPLPFLTVSRSSLENVLSFSEFPVLIAICFHSSYIAPHLILKEYHWFITGTFQSPYRLQIRTPWFKIHSLCWLLTYQYPKHERCYILIPYACHHNLKPGCFLHFFLYNQNCLIYLWLIP